MKTVIGKRTAANIAGYIIGCIVAIGLLIYILTKSKVGDLDNFYIVSLIIICVTFLVCLIIEIQKPTNAIEYDEEYLYLNYKKYIIQIEIESIIHATPRRKTRNTYYHYSYGKVIIHSKYGAHTISNIADCEKVCLNIMRLKKNNLY